MNNMFGIVATKWILVFLLFFVLPVALMRLMVYKTIEVRRRDR